MSKQRTFVLIIIIVLGLLAIAGVTFWYVQRNPEVLFKTIETFTGESDLSAPVELTTGFDPTKNAPRFVIESVSREAKTFNLKMVYPQIRTGEWVVSRINCGEMDIKINGKLAREEALFDKVEIVPKDSMIFSGLCSGRGCSEINKNCELYTSGGNRNER